MIARLRVRRSRMARISRWLGVLSIPVLAITALAHRFGVMDPVAALMAIGLGLFAALMAVVFAVSALVLIWHDGRLGARDALRGLVFGLIALVPLGFVVYGILQFPRLNDVSTDIVAPPVLTSVNRYDRWGANDAAPPPESDRALQRAAYPDIVSRRFPLTPRQMFTATQRTVGRLGWDIVFVRSPTEETATGEFQVVARTLVFAFPDDVAIRLLPDRYGARLDIRSASRYGSHDIGANAERIRGFFETLDEAVLEVVAEAVPEDGEEDQGDGQPASQ